MEITAIKDPKDNQIINKDESVTNKDGDNYLEKGEQPIDQKDPAGEQVPALKPDNGVEHTDPLVEEGTSKKK